MTTSARLDLIKNVFQSFVEQGNIEPLLAAMTDDVVFRLTVQPGTPLSGTFQGKDGVRTYFVRNAETVETTAFAITNYLVGGDQIAVVGTESLKVLRSRQTVADATWITLFTFQGDQISEVTVVEDTAAIAAAYPR